MSANALCLLAVPVGSQLCISARVGHDSIDGAAELQTSGLAGSDPWHPAMVRDDRTCCLALLSMPFSVRFLYLSALPMCPLTLHVHFPCTCSRSSVIYLLCACVRVGMRCGMPTRMTMLPSNTDPVIREIGDRGKSRLHMNQGLIAAPDAAHELSTALERAILAPAALAEPSAIFPSTPKLESTQLNFTPSLQQEWTRSQQSNESGQTHSTQKQMQQQV
eukprot:SAG31_NODE_9334_length_1295_cov_1.314381_1_plen_218_part_10